MAIVANANNVQRAFRWNGSSWQQQSLINADVIFANAIGTDQLEISTSSGSSRIFMDGANNRIEIFDSSAVNPRVRLGNLS